MMIYAKPNPLKWEIHVRSDGMTSDFINPVKRMVYFIYSGTILHIPAEVVELG